MPTEVVKSLSLEDFKTWLDKGRNWPHVNDPALSSGLDWRPPKASSNLNEAAMLLYKDDFITSVIEQL